MELNVSTWGNSLGLRIPKAIADLMGIEKGSKVLAEFKGGKLVISPAVDLSLQALAKGIDIKSLAAKVTPKNMHFSSEEEDIPVGKEIW